MTTAAPLPARLRAVALSSHPGPTVLVTVLAVVLSVAVGHHPGRTVLVALAVLFGQLSIGLANDWIDADRDRAVGRTDKPVVRGDVSPATVRTAALACLVVALLLSFLLGPAAGVAHTVLVLSGLAYDVGLKRTAASVVPFVVSFGLLPAVVTLASSPPAAPAAWAVGVGAVFGVAVHFTNVLPDLDDDARTGVSGLPHRIGRVRSGVVAFGALLGAGCLVVVGQVGGPVGPGGASTFVALLGAVGVMGIAAVGVRLAIWRPPSRTTFRLVMAAALLVALSLGLSGTRLVA
ncbi:UbiA family prenyltransferase [Frigoribacterium salinisoli]